LDRIAGIDFVHEEKQKSLEEVTVKRAMEDVEIQDDGETEGGGDVFAAYYAEGSGEKQADRPVVFMPEMGLAMESLKGDFTIESLWSAM
jgi:Bardet-Biedl syndrome 5 protein